MRSCELLTLADAKPRIVGVATIEPYSELDGRRCLKAVFAANRVHALASYLARDAAQDTLRHAR
jgi:hypothetical protein